MKLRSEPWFVGIGTIFMLTGCIQFPPVPLCTTTITRLSLPGSCRSLRESSNTTILFNKTVADTNETSKKPCYRVHASAAHLEGRSKNGSMVTFKSPLVGCVSPDSRFHPPLPPTSALER
jgi:hypothetical protein